MISMNRCQQNRIDRTATAGVLTFVERARLKEELPNLLKKLTQMQLQVGNFRLSKDWLDLRDNKIVDMSGLNELNLTRLSTLLMSTYFS